MLVKHVQAPLDVTVGLERSYTRAEIEVQHTDLFSSGGHLKPDPFSRAASILKTHGREVSEHVASFEARQVKEVKEFVILRRPKSWTSAFMRQGEISSSLISLVLPRRAFLQ
jgi:hypothetical protein